MSTLLLTGIPRSGTTLTCHLLNQCSGTVALHEPLSPSLIEGDAKPATNVILSLIHNIRAELLETGTTISKQAGGSLPSNPVARTQKGREEVVELGEFNAGKPLGEHFRLIVKHNALFTALWPLLEKHFPIYAVIRNPLPVLASWQSVDLPVAAGTIPMGERFDPILTGMLAETSDVLEKQLVILNWFFERYRLCDPSGVLRYEEIIETDGACLSMLTGKEPVTPPLNEQLTNSEVSEAILKKLKDRLLDQPAIYEPFYTPDDLQTKYLEMVK